MARRFQRGSLRVEARKGGKTWVLRFRTVRATDGKRVEHTLPLGLVRDLSSESAAWAEVEKRHLNRYINQPVGRATLAVIANHYVDHELPKRAATTQYLHRHIVNDFLIPRWGCQLATAIKPLEVEQWLEGLRGEMANATRGKLRDVMSRIYTHAQKHELISREQSANPFPWVHCERTTEYEAVVLRPEQAWALVSEFPLLERTLTILDAATALRISELLGLQWQDVDFANHKIHVRRTWINGETGKPKSKASAKPVPMTDLLAAVMAEWHGETTYAKPTDWVFASSRMKGKQPRTGSTMAKGYLRPAAVKLGILGKKDKGRFGFHNLRHSLASFLISKGTDVKTVQSLLRHANARTTLELYTHAMTEAKMLAQRQLLEAMKPGPVN